METASTQSNSSNRKKKFAFKKRKVLALVIGIAVAVGIMALSFMMLHRSSTASTIDSNKYQAVFFTNGQVYFGKLDQVNADYFKLNDVFYIQAANAQTEGNNSENPQETSAQSTDIRLIKLGSEVHAPDDEMIISKDQILFFENLKTEGKVTDSIIKYNQQRQ